MRQSFREYSVSFATIVLACGIVSCADPGCPSGTRAMGDRCIVIDDASMPSEPSMSSAITGTPDSAGTGAQAPAAAPSNGGTNGGVAGQADAHGANAGAPSAPAGEAMSPMSSGAMSTDPCAGRGESVGCEGNILVRCDAAGTTVSRDSCASPTLCQIGLASGSCASCAPGTHRCSGADLELCGADGKYAVVKTCESVALCSASAGDCTTQACSPNAKVCEASGMLQTCNADGTQLIAAEHCGPSLCDAKEGKCNTCVPRSARCDGNNLVECAVDGQTETIVPCTAADDCHTSTCMLGKCVTLPKVLGASCASAKICDGEGRCVGCLADRDCGANELCTDQMCVVKACTPNSATCTASGTLQICDSTGLRVETTMQCGQRRCNEAGRSCYACVPNEATCSGQTARKCAADGSRVTEARCAAEGECTSATCTAGECETTPVSRGTRCSAGKCDGSGRCVPCLDGDTASCTDVPRGQCAPGRRTCRNNQWDACSGTAGSAEVCGGGDEDCDGSVDECPAGQMCQGGSCQRPARCGDGIVTPDEECDNPDDQYSCDPTTCRVRTYYTYCADDAQCLGNSFCYEGKCIMECAASGVCRDWFGVQGACFTGVCLRTCDAASCPPTMTCMPGADAEAASLCS